MTTKRQAMRTLAVDEENGCDLCWERARAAMPDLDRRLDGTGRMRVTREELKLLCFLCDHGAPEYAPSIFLLRP